MDIEAEEITLKLEARSIRSLIFQALIDDSLVIDYFINYRSLMDQKSKGHDLIGSKSDRID